MRYSFREILVGILTGVVVLLVNIGAIVLTIWLIKIIIFP